MTPIAQNGGGASVVILVASGLFGLLLFVLSGLGFIKLRVPTSIYMLTLGLFVGFGVLITSVNLSSSFAIARMAPPEMQDSLLLGGTSIALRDLHGTLLAGGAALTISGLLVALATWSPRFQGGTTSWARARVAVAVAGLGGMIALILSLVLGVFPGTSLSALAWSQTPLYADALPQALAWFGGLAALGLGSARTSTHLEDGPRLAVVSAKASVLATLGLAFTVGASWVLNTQTLMGQVAVMDPDARLNLGADAIDTSLIVAAPGIVAVTFLAICPLGIAWGNRAHLSRPRTLVGAALSGLCIVAVVASGALLWGPITSPASVAFAAPPPQTSPPPPQTSPPTTPPVSASASTPLPTLAEPAWMTRRVLRGPLEMTFQDGGGIEIMDGPFEWTGPASRDPLRSRWSEIIAEQRELAKMVGMDPTELSGFTHVVATSQERWSRMRPLLSEAADLATTLHQPTLVIHVQTQAGDKAGVFTRCLVHEGEGWTPPEDASWQDVVDGLVARPDTCLKP
ncbi:MAG: hypothetical protein AB8H79_00605 [Myxococcota bacterium]